MISKTTKYTGTVDVTLSPRLAMFFRNIIALLSHDVVPYGHRLVGDLAAVWDRLPEFEDVPDDDEGEPDDVEQAVLGNLWRVSCSDVGEDTENRYDLS